ncbi:acetylornithine aminotransferase [Scheffersomyces coipomensis]|uniref:acetylornithine aminotransferase n=1 Tax=Scheffersomyces coipomensis TaxID=1788519 RepID=UPI00315D0E8D
MLRQLATRQVRLTSKGGVSFARNIRHISNIVSQKDASEDSQTGKFINTLNKPYSVTTYARPNLVLTHGKGSLLYDLENRQYVDFTSGIAVTCLGHANKELAEIIHDQSTKLLHCSNLYYNLPAGELANKLVSKTKESGGMKDAQRVFLCNSGTEANEAALKFARKYGKSINENKIEIITFNNSFHGRSMGALSVTPNPKYQAPFAPLIPGVQVADTADIESVKSLIHKDKTCAVIIEPIQGEGGINVVSEKFLTELRKLCDDNEVLLIFDEIQCGLGRTGKLWAHSNLEQAVHPDILTMAKALGNGFPIGATMITEKVENSLAVGDHGTTYGGNALGARIGSFVVDKITDETFSEGVNEKSAIFVSLLSKIVEKYPDHVESVKGKGLLLGLQFKDNLTNSAVVDKCRENGLLAITAALNVLRIVPALNIPNDLIREGVEILDFSIKQVIEESK